MGGMSDGSWRACPEALRSSTMGASGTSATGRHEPYHIGRLLAHSGRTAPGRKCPPSEMNRTIDRHTLVSESDPEREAGRFGRSADVVSYPVRATLRLAPPFEHLQ